MSESFKDQKPGFGLALSTALRIPLNIFIIPVTIWKGAQERLNILGQDSINNSFRKTEMIVFNWFKTLFDSLIFLSWPIMIIVAISVGASTYRGGEKVLPILILGYFTPIILSFLKESISIGLIMVLKVEQIERNTSQTSRATPGLHTTEPVGKDQSIDT